MPKTLGERISQEFQESMENLREFGENFLVWLVGALPVIVILALLAGLLIYETRKMKTYSNPYAKALEEKQAAAAKEESSAGSDSSGVNHACTWTSSGMESSSLGSIISQIP